MKDYQCSYDNTVEIPKKIVEELGLVFPDAYLHQETMVRMALTLKELEGVPYCALPFCHTVEAEAMGGHVRYGNETAGPRAGEAICTSLEQVLELSEIDYTSGRIHEVLLACKNLQEKGEHVALQISGPFTILNGLIDAKYVFKSMRKDPELFKKVCRKIGEELLRFIEEAGKNGVDMISYADAAGGVNILGPKLAEQMVRDFTYGFLKQATEQMKENQVLLLCPKTTYALVETDLAQFTDRKVTAATYGEACVQMIGQVQIVGQMCMKNAGCVLTNGILKEIRLR